MIKRAMVIFFVLILFSSAYGENPFHEGFNGIKWGTYKDNLPNLGLSSKSIKKIYKNGESSVLFMEGKGSLKMEFKRVPLLSIFFKFRDGVFYGVDMVFNKLHHKKLLNLLKKNIGAPYSNSGFETVWEEKTVAIKLTDREIIVSSK